MKTHQQQSNAADAGAKTKFGRNKMQVLKPCTHINKSSGDVLAFSIFDVAYLVIYCNSNLTKAIQKKKKNYCTETIIYPVKFASRIFPTQTRTSFSGSVAAKCRKGVGSSPSQSHTETEIAYKVGILTETPSQDSKKLSARPLSHSGKIKLQLFPIDENIQRILQQVSNVSYKKSSS